WCFACAVALLGHSVAILLASRGDDARSKLDLVANCLQAGFGAALVLLAGRRPGYVDGASHGGAALDHHAAAEQHDMGQIAEAGERLPRLCWLDEIPCIGPEPQCSPGLVGGGGWRMRSGEAVAQHALRLPEAVDHGDRDLVAARTACLERDFGEIERKVGAQTI